MDTRAKTAALSIGSSLLVVAAAILIDRKWPQAVVPILIVCGVFLLVVGVTQAMMRRRPPKG